MSHIGEGNFTDVSMHLAERAHERCVHMFVCACVCVCVCVCVRVFVCWYLHVFVYVCVYLYVFCVGLYRCFDASC